MIKKVFEPYKKLPFNVFVIFFARIVNAAGHFVIPFTTLLLTEKYGLPSDRTGFYVMLTAIAYIPGSFMGGKLSDHIGRKKIFVIFQSLAALCFIFCGFITSTSIIPILLILSSLFYGFAGPANSAMIADITNSQNRKEAYSLLYLGHNLGFALGPMIAGLLYNNYVLWLFLGDAFTTFISVALVAIFIKETMPDKEKMQDSNNELTENEKAEEGSFISAWLKRPVLSSFMFLIMLYSFIYVQHQFTLPIQLEEIFHKSGPRNYGFLMTVNALTVILFTPLITRLTLHIRPIKCVGLGGLLYGIGFGILGYVNMMSLFITSTFIWTIGEILISTNAMAFVANNTPISHRGRFNAVIPIIAEAGHALGPFLTGKYLMTNSIKSLWQICFILAVISSICMFILQRFDNNRIKSSTTD